MTREDQPPILERVDAGIQERLFHPVVNELYEEYLNLGIADALVLILEKIPEPLLDPIIHTQTSHITKEKPVFIAELALDNGVAKEDALLVAAVTDLLWSLSLIYDDIEDHDQHRAGKQSAWVKFGKETAYQAAEIGFKATLQTLSEEICPDSAKQCERHVMAGVESIREHVELKISEANEEILIANYQKRADFHTIFPVETLFQGQDEDRVYKAKEAITEVNLAGQVLNDLKDMSPKHAWQREGFSDIRSGLVTLPNLVLYSRLDIGQQRSFLNKFGKAHLEESHKTDILDLIDRTQTLMDLKTYVEYKYERSRKHFSHSLSPRSQHYIDIWIDYKLEQLKGL